MRKNIQKSLGTVGFLFVILSLSTAWGATAEEFPKHTITIVCGSGPGSSMDVMTRVLAKCMGKYVKQPVIVINKTGGDATLNDSFVKAQPADGHFLSTEATTYTLNIQRKDVDMSLADFVLVTRIHLDPFVFFVREGGPYKTLADFVKDAKAKPGKITIAGFSSVSGQHVAQILFEKEAGIKCKWMAYKGGPEAIVSLMGGNAEGMMGNSDYVRQYRGKVRVVAHMGEKPLELAPEVPSFKQLGYSDDLVRYHWRGLPVRAETPPAIVERLHELITKATREPEFLEFTKNQGLIDGYLPLEKMKDFIDKSAKTDKEILRMLNVEVK
jgi:tripartite-type tricarboxylate transporter receptor subunit TctC